MGSKCYHLPSAVCSFRNTLFRLTKAANNVKYSLYWSSLPEVDDGTCTAASENATLRENPNCLFWSACGLKNAAEGRSDWVTLAPNVGHVFEVLLFVLQVSAG